MKNAETIWVLPHSDQSDDEDVVKDGRSMKLAQAIAVENLPKELAFGIPESLLRAHPRQSIVFSQYIRQPEMDRALLSISVPCGEDKDARTIYLTLVEILPLEMEPRLRPSLVGLTASDLQVAESLLKRLNNPIDPWADRVHEMVAAIRSNPRVLSFANVTVPQAVFPCQWTPEKKNVSGWPWRLPPQPP